MSTLWCTDVPFTSDELATLRTHGFALVADRVIHNAQPPISDADAALIEQHIGAPIPPQLAALWRFTAGGRLDHDLWLVDGGDVQSVSWTDLFYIGATTYDDLLGWIDAQREFTTDEAEELGIDWDGALPAVPFGGFEYLERLFVDRRTGEVVLWREGTPGWTSGPHERTQGVIAPDLPAAFGLLFYADELRDPVTDYPSGRELVRAITEARLPGDLADRLLAYAERAVADWRPLLDPALAGRLERADATRLWHVAASRARATRDAELAGRLAPIAGPGTDSDGIIRDALSHGAPDVALAYLRAGWPTPPGALGAIGEAISPELVEELIRGGAMVKRQDLAQLASDHGAEIADLAQRLDGTIDDTGARAAAIQLVDELEELLTRARENNPHGDHAHLRRRISRTRAYAKHKGGLWPWRR